MKQTKRILYQNAFRQIRMDEFNDSVEIAPMSQWKQQRSLSLKNEILASDTYSNREIYHLTNEWQEKRRAKIYDDERHSIDTSIETLELLNIIIYNKNEIDTNGISMPGLVTLGHYLRKKGDRVDFVKLDKFISKLFMRRMASMIASLLIDILGFDASELPFLYHKQKHLEEKLLAQYSCEQNSTLFSQSLSLLRTSPLTVMTYWGRKVKSMLSDIQE